MRLDSDEGEVSRSVTVSSDQVCSEVLEIEGSHNQSTLTVLPRGKSLSRASGGLSCWYTNATSLNPSKLNDIRAECIDTDFDIRFVTET